jgi:hypothetical protein
MGPGKSLPSGECPPPAVQVAGRGRAFSISNRSTPSSFGFRAASNASPKNSAQRLSAQPWGVCHDLPAARRTG